MSKELMVTENYAISTMSTQDLTEVIAENLGGEEITANDLDKVKIPTGGGQVWEIPDIIEGVKPAKELTGIIILKKRTNAYWDKAFEGQNEPPVCVSKDGSIGQGTPGGICKTCPLNQFGSDGKNGKACKNMQPLFILIEGSMLPLSVMIPPTSLKDAKHYFLGLAGRGIKYPHVITKLSLEKAQSNDGITYSKVKFEYASSLSSEEISKIEAYRSAILPALESIQLDDMTGPVQDGNFDD